MRPYQRHKYNAVRTEYDGIKFSSKKEADYYRQLKTYQDGGYVIFFLMQVPFHLPGKAKYICDFQVFYADGTVRFVDVKGMETPMFKMKKKMVESLYPVTIETV